MSSPARNNVARPEVDVAVVGAGIAGLVAARELAQRGLSTVVLEKDDHTGGRIQTEHGPDCYLEHGGIFHTHGYHATRRLIDEVGLTGKVAAVPTAFHSAVRVANGWEHVDYGALTGPLRTGALGWPDRLSLLRAAVPALLARPTDLGDLTSLARFDTKPSTSGLTARAGTYFTAGPHEFLWGVPSSDVSYAMLAMQLHVFKGELREITGGTGQLVERIARDLDVRHGCAVERVEARDDDVVLHLAGDERPVRARGVVLACPADVAAKLWPDAPGPVLDHLASMTYSRIDYVYLATKRPITNNAVGRAVGMEVITTPEAGGNTIGGIYYSNGWANQGGLLLVTAAPAAGAAHLDDETLADRLQVDAERLHPELVGQVTDRVVIRHDPFVPCFRPGSISRLAEAREVLPAGRVDLAGDHMTAPWVEGAVRSGQQAASRLRTALGR